MFVTPARALPLCALLLLGCGSRSGQPGPESPSDPAADPAPIARSGPADLLVGSPLAGMPAGRFAPRLAQGWNSISEEGRASCLGASTVSTPAADVLQRFARPLDAGELAWLGGATPGTALRLHPSRVTDVAVLAFANPLSLVYAYGVVHAVRHDSVDLGTAALTVPTGEVLRSRFGDAFASRAAMGGFFIVAFRFEFASASALREFQAAVGSEAAAWDLWPRILARGDRLTGWSRGGMMLVQGGGDVLAEPASAAGEALAPCLLGDLSACSTMVDRLVAHYTAEGPGSFRERIGAAPGILAFEVAPYETVGGPVLDRVVPEPVRLARQRLHGLLDAQRLIVDRALHAQGFPTALDLEELERRAARNVACVADALQRCYEVADPAEAAAVASCAQGALDESLLAAGFDPTLSLAALEPL